MNDQREDLFKDGWPCKPKPLMPPTGYRVIHLKPSDVILLECERILTSAQGNNLLAIIDEYYPDNKKVILDGGVKFKVVTNEKDT